MPFVTMQLAEKINVAQTLLVTHESFWAIGLWQVAAGSVWQQEKRAPVEFGGRSLPLCPRRTT